MTRHSLSISFVLLVMYSSLFAASGMESADPYSREPLKKNDVELVEGRNILLTKDSYPRQAADPVTDLLVLPTESGAKISFSLNRYDDVEVAIVDAQGEVVRYVAVGLLGPNAPAPLQTNSLQQELLWDGLNAKGEAVDPAQHSVRVSVGYEAAFKQFVGFDPSQVSQYICGLEVDPQGRVYVMLHTDNHGDYSVLRFNKNGEYEEQVHPPSPEGVSFEEMKERWPYTRKLDGKSVPSRLHAEQYWIWRWAGWQPFPLRISREGTAYLFDTDTHWWSGGFHNPEGFRMWTEENLERFWFTPSGMTLFGRSGGIALDDRGHVLLGSRSKANSMKSLPPRGFDNTESIGRIRKVDLETGKMVAAFEWNGLEKNETPSKYLGTHQLNQHLPQLFRRSPDARKDSENKFIDICGLDVDDQERIYVLDGFPRRVKIYEGNGKWIGEISSLRMHGREQTFWNLTGIRCSGESVYFSGNLYRDEGESGFLAKFDMSSGKPEFRWALPVDGLVRTIAIDDFSQENPVIWVGNANGSHSFSRVEDLGDSPGEPAHFSGLKPGTFVQPLEVAAMGEGELVAFDFGRKKLIKTNDAGTLWKEVEIPVWGEREDFLRDMNPIHWRPYANDPGQISNMKWDPVNERLLVGYGRYEFSPQFEAYDRDMNFLDFKLEKAGGNRFFATEGWGVNFAGTDAEGNLYVYDKLASMNQQRIRPLSWSIDQYGGKYGAIRKYDSDGKIVGEVVKLFHPSGSVALDSKQNIYAIDMAKSSYEDAFFYFPYYKDSYELYEGYENKPHFTRDGKAVLHQSDLTYLVKFGPEGGERNAATEEWAHRGVGTHASEGCYCDMPSNLLTIDAADRIYAADSVNYRIKVLDTAGNVLGTFGEYGNANIQPEGDAKGPVGFRNIHALDSSGTSVYVSDKDLNRLVKFQAGYRQVLTKPLR